MRPAAACRSTLAEEGLFTPRRSTRQVNVKSSNINSNNNNLPTSDMSLGKKKADRATQKRGARDTREAKEGRKKARVEHICEKETSCYPEVYEISDDFPGKGWTNSDDPPPLIGKRQSDNTTGGKAWWCKTPHADGDYCMSARRPTCPGCNLARDGWEPSDTSKSLAKGGCLDREANFFIAYSPKGEGNKDKRPQSNGYAIFQKQTTWIPKLKKAAGGSEGNSASMPHSQNAKAARLVQALTRRGVALEMALVHARTPFVLKLSKKDFAEWSHINEPEPHVSASSVE
jgi:hypothetical protein